MQVAIRFRRLLLRVGCFFIFRFALVLHRVVGVAVEDFNVQIMRLSWRDWRAAARAMGARVNHSAPSLPNTTTAVTIFHRHPPASLSRSFRSSLFAYFLLVPLLKS
jgi:hypothetical protein